MEVGAEVEAVVEVEVAVAEVSIRERGDIDQLFYLLSNTKVTPSLGCKEGRDGLKPFLDFRPFSFFLAQSLGILFPLIRIMS